MNTNFWTVFKADLLFSLCSITVTVIITLIVSRYRKAKLAKAKVNENKDQGPRPHVIVIGGKDPNPGHCPLCGQGWPLQGPAGPPEKL